MMQQMTAERKKKTIIAEAEGDADAEIKRVEVLKKITEAEQNYLSVLKNKDFPHFLK